MRIYNRPADVTEEDLRGWRARDHSTIRDAIELMRTVFPSMEPMDPAEIWGSGCWLLGKLLVAGCDPALAQNICIAQGQRVAASAEDPWDIARQVLDRYHRGEWDTPGPELAERLSTEYAPALVKKYGRPDVRALMGLRGLLAERKWLV